MNTSFRLHSGDQAPRQTTPTTCGAACLTVARMLVDPPFARWIIAGEGRPVGAPDGATEAERFSAYEAVVQRRTNAFRAPDGRPSLPWPRSLGTPPWGARRELEAGAARRGLDYDIVPIRADSATTLRRRHARLVELVEDGVPALLYVGSRTLPRHVTLVLPGDGDSYLDVYDPYTGQVTLLDDRRFASGRLGLAGWDLPWVLVQPSERKPILDTVGDLVRDALPRPMPHGGHVTTSEVSPTRGARG